jgi:hypothetical protein
LENSLSVTASSALSAGVSFSSASAVCVFAGASSFAAFDALSCAEPPQPVSTDAVIAAVSKVANIFFFITISSRFLFCFDGFILPSRKAGLQISIFQNGGIFSSV